MKINNDVLAVLSQATINGNAVTLNGQLDRKLYTKTNEVMEAAGGKWNRKAKAHLFDNDPTEIIEQVILTGEILKPQDFGYFPSPEPVVNRLMELADVKPGMFVLEPSAGQGNIAREIAQIATVDCVELLPDNAKHLMDFSNAVLVSDFLQLQPVQMYDRVVMNPPFERQADILHVQHAFKFLKPGGRLVSVMGAGIMFRENKLTREFREFIDENDGEIEQLPEGVFKVSGTGVSTVIVSLNCLN